MGAYVFIWLLSLAKLNSQIFDIWLYLLGKLGGQISDIWLQMLTLSGAWADQALSRLFILVTGENLQIHVIVQGQFKGTTQRGCKCFHLASFVGQIKHQIFDIWLYIYWKNLAAKYLWLQMVAKLGGQPAKACLGQPRVVLISCRASPTCHRPNFSKSLKFSSHLQRRCSQVLKSQRFIRPSGPSPLLAIGRLFYFYGISLLALT